MERIINCYYKGGAPFRRVGELLSARHQRHPVYDHRGFTTRLGSQGGHRAAAVHATTLFEFRAYDN